MQVESLRFLLIVLMSIICITMSEPNDFDYKNHGSDWKGDCTAQDSNKQSPIILPERSKITSEKTSYLFADFKNTESKATIYNTTILIQPINQQQTFGNIYTKVIKENHNSFVAKQIRIRTRSEHRINDQTGYYDLQVQISSTQLFDKQSNAKLMMGLLFQAKEEYPQDPFLAQIIKSCQSRDFEKEFLMSTDLSHLLSRQRIFNYWFYLGSITIPTCKNGGMNWVIPHNIYKMNTQQLQFFKHFYNKDGKDGNWRDVQVDEGNQIGYANVLPEIPQL